MIKYCGKCHREVYRLEKAGDTIKVVQNGRTFLNVSNKSSIDIALTCPSNHQVQLVIKPEIEPGIVIKEAVA